MQTLNIQYLLFVEVAPRFSKTLRTALTQPLSIFA